MRFWAVQAFVAIVAAVALALLATPACSSSSTPVGPNVGPDGCPLEAPVEGSACSPAGASCGYPSGICGCGGFSYSCIDGAWVEFGASCTLCGDIDGG